MPGEADDQTPTPTPSLMDAPPAAGGEQEETPNAEEGDAGAPPAGDDAAAGDAGDAASAGSDDGDGKGPAEGEGEGEIEYTDFTVPEGIELDPEVVEEFKPIAKELGLKQEDAQKFIDLQTKVAQRWQEQVQQHVVDTRLGWREAAQKDEELGGDKFAENLAVAKLGRDTFGNDALKALLDESGLGDHPEVIRFFYKVGKANSEHDFVNSGKPEKSKSFYDHPTSKK